MNASIYAAYRVIAHGQNLQVRDLATRSLAWYIAQQAATGSTGGM
jgi:hypothetical protein